MEIICAVRTIVTLYKEMKRLIDVDDALYPEAKKPARG